MSEIAADKIRSNRETLGVSRATLQKATGLSSSVIWRSEQKDAKPLTGEEYAKILDVLDDWMANGVPAEYAKATKTHAAPSDGTKDLLKLTGRYYQFLEDLQQSVSDKIIVAREAKARTKELVQLQTELENFIKTL